MMTTRSWLGARLHKELGSFTLSALYATAAGVVFTLLFINMVHYVGAVNGVEQAARKASRCINPTDGECVAVQSNSKALFDWFGVTGSEETKVDYMVDRYLYTATLLEETWEARYQTFEIQQAIPRAEWTSSQVRVSHLEAPLNHYLNGFATMRLPTFRSQQILRPLFTEFQNFPPENTMDNRGNHANPIQMVSFQREEGNNIAWGTAWVTSPSMGKGFSLLPPAGSQLVVRSEKISVPALPGELECIGNDGTHCKNEVNASSGDNASLLEWHRFARVAILPMALVRNTGGRGNGVRWGRIDGSSSLRLHAYHPDGSSFSPPEGYCLGDRRRTVLGPGETWFNMDVRGPKGANDGATGPCGGLGDFDGIRVPRGGSFVIEASLRRTEDSVGPAELFAHIRFLYWFDQYRLDQVETPGPEIICNNVHFSTSLNRPLCEEINITTECETAETNLRPDMNACLGLSWFPRLNFTHYEPACEDDGHAFFVRDVDRQKNGKPFHAIQKGETLMCGIEEPLPAAPKGSILCDGWKEVASRILNIAGKVSGCEEARHISHLDECGEAIPISKQGNLKNCPALQGTIQKASKETAWLEKNVKLPEAVHISASQINDIHWNMDEQRTWELRWALTSSDPVPKIDCSTAKEERQDEAACSSMNIVQNKPEIPLYQLLHDSQEKRISHNPRRYFDITPHGNFEETPNDEFLKNHVSFQKREETKEIPVTGGYPFTGQPEPEIPYHGQQGVIADFNLDCTFESECSSSQNQVFATQEEILRNYATALMPTLTDPEIKVNFSTPQYVDTLFLSKFEAHTLIEQRACTPTKTACHNAPGENPSIIHIGTFPSSGDKTIPASCQNKTYEYCFSRLSREKNTNGGILTEVDGEENSNFVFTPNLPHAANVGLLELKRYIPTARTQCGQEAGSGCAHIEITTDAGPYTDITASYELPLFFPLSTFLGEESIEVTHTKREIREIEANGRFVIQ